MAGYARAAATMILMEALAVSRTRFTGRLAARFFIRFHMGLIFAGTVATAVVVSRLLLAAGVQSLLLRYALTVIGAYALFFVLVRVWIAYVARVGPRDVGLDLPDVIPTGGGGASGFQPGGGLSGGAGASGSFGDGGDVPVFRSLAEAGSGGADGGSVGGGRGSGDWFSFDLDDGIVLVIALLLLVSVLGGTAIWLIWQAPVILPEAAFEALLASGLIKAARRGEARGWARGVLKSTVIPFVLVLAAASFVGWAGQRVCPPATRLTDVVRICYGSSQSPKPMPQTR
jgi:hypothetical protein